MIETHNILCSGPSLTKTFNDGIKGLRIGVNRAVLCFKTDWLVVQDQLAWQNLDITHHDKIFTVHEGRKWGCSNIEKEVETLFGLYPPTMKWTVFSSTAAIVLSHFLGGRQINIYGADMCGIDYCDGYRLPNVKCYVRRWKSEHDILSSLCQWLYDKDGTRVQRTLDNGTIKRCYQNAG